MKILKWILRAISALFALCLLILGFLRLYLPYGNFGYARETDDQKMRFDYIQEAMLYAGAEEGSNTHKKIIDGYNAHKPLAQGYEVQYDDDWCATFVSYVAIRETMTDFIPTECGCQRQIGLWQDLGRWEENDTYLPLPGDIIYYDWDVRTLGDSTGWADHVGIVIGTHGPFIKVIEGNKDDAVGYRYIIRWDPRIRGYGLPDYS